MDIVYGAFSDDRELILKASHDLGFLTGEESKEMLAHHFAGAAAVAEPFKWNETECYDFGSESCIKRLYEIVA